jgi:hypothetical protein
LLYNISSTGAKGSTQTNKKIRVRVQKKGAKENEDNPGLEHWTVSGAPGWIDFKLFTFGFFQEHSAIIHQTVRWVTGLSGATSGATTIRVTVDCTVP